MKDYIDIYGDNNNSSTMEAVCTFELNNSSFIIYSDLDKSHYYLSDRMWLALLTKVRYTHPLHQVFYQHTLLPYQILLNSYSL